METAPTDTRTRRDSNMEIIRILAMSMILILHTIAHTSLIHIFPDTRYIMPMVVGGVDLFILISGYYLIKLNWKSVLYLLVLLWAFQTFVLMALYITGEIHRVSHITIIGTYLSPFTNNEYWFIRVYFMLMLISPLINSTLKSIPSDKYIYLLSLLTIIEVYALWMMQLYNKDTGVSLYNFIYLYILGHSLNKFRISQKYTTTTLSIVGIASLSVNMVINALTLWYFSNDHGGYMNSYTYNYCNPFTIIMCVCIILLLDKHKFHNKTINSLASASLGAYLLQDGLLGTHFLYDFQTSALNSSILDFMITAISVFFSLWIASWIITYCTRKYLYIRLIKTLNSKLPNIYKFDFNDFHG